jgi:hypothetical protein
MAKLKSLVSFFDKNTLVKAGDVLADKLINDLKLVEGKHFIKLEDYSIAASVNNNKNVEQPQTKAKV